MDNLIPELMLSTAVVSATVVIHLIGLDILQILTGWHLERFTTWIHLDRMIVPLGIVLGLFVIHGFEIWIYALTYWKMGLLPTLEQSLYFSTSAYSTLGETGAILPIPWRIVGVRGDGAAFVWRYRPLVYRFEDGHGGVAYPEAQFGQKIAEYAWLMPDGTFRPVLVRPVPVAPGSLFTANDGYLDDTGQYHSLQDVTPIDGLTVATGPNSALYTNAWFPEAVGSDGRVAFSGEDWRYGRTFLAVGSPGTRDAAFLDSIEVDVAAGGGRFDPRQYGSVALARDGSTFYRAELDSVHGYDRLRLADPTPRTLRECGFALPLASMADDGSLLVLPCSTHGVSEPQTDLTVTRGGVTVQTYHGAPLVNASVHDRGWVSATADFLTPRQRCVVVVGGRATDLADAFVALPGGVGTLEELAEILTWAILGMHAKPVGLLDVDGFYAPLVGFLDHAEREGFLAEEQRRFLLVERDPGALLERMAAFVPPRVQAWISPKET